MTRQSLHQMNMVYSQEEDRLLLRITTMDHMEYQLWITRRFLSLFWEVLNKVLNKFEHVDPANLYMDTETQKAYQHQKAIEAADFSKKYEAENYTQVNETPILIIGAQVKVISGNVIGIKLDLKNSQTVSFNIPLAMLHALCQMIVSACKTTRWSLDLKMGEFDMSHIDSSKVH